MKYVKKPIVVEAIQIQRNPTTEEIMSYPLWFIEAIKNLEVRDAEDGSGLVVSTLEGNMLCRWGNYIIQGVNGELYPCDCEIFNKTYEPVV